MNASVEPEITIPLDIVTYTISLTNIDATDAKDVVITSSLPAGFTYRYGSTTGATTANPQIVGQEFSWTLPDIPKNGANLELQFKATSSSLTGNFYIQVSGTSSNGSVHPTGETALVVVRQEIEGNILFLPVIK